MLPVDAPSEPFRFGEGQLKSPFDVCVVPCGDVVVCDPGTCSLVVFAPDGSLLRKVRMSPGRLPIALASHGSVTYLLDGNNSIVRAFH